MIRQCQDGSCPCSSGACQLDVALTRYEIEFEMLPAELIEVREEVRRKLSNAAVASIADTIPGFLCGQQPIADNTAANLNPETFKIRLAD